MAGLTRRSKQAARATHADKRDRNTSYVATVAPNLLSTLIEFAILRIVTRDLPEVPRIMKEQDEKQEETKTSGGTSGTAKNKSKETPTAAAVEATSNTETASIRVSPRTTGTPSPPPAATATAAAVPSAADNRKSNKREEVETSFPWKECRVHRPTLEELRNTTFSEYVSKTVLRQASEIFHQKLRKKRLERKQQRQQQQQREQTGAGGDPGNSNSGNTGNGGDDSADDDDSESETDFDIDEDDDDDKDYTQEEMPLAQGIAKIALPPELFYYGVDTFDTTGRLGPEWQPSSTPTASSEGKEEGNKDGKTEARSKRKSSEKKMHGKAEQQPPQTEPKTFGDRVLPSPMAQHLRGLAGIYEFTFTDQPTMTVAQFRDKADAYRNQQVGSAFDADLEEQKCDPEKKRMAHLERLFWKRLGPTMPPAMYGADLEGSLFVNRKENQEDDDEDSESDNGSHDDNDSESGSSSDEDDDTDDEEVDEEDKACGWSIRHMDSCLHVLSYVPGVTSPYLYFGMWASCFCVHTEDMNLLSINYLHAGAPKLWYAVAPKDAPRLEALATHHFHHAAINCKEFLRHKRCLISPRVLHRAGISFTTTIQYPGEAVITMPNGYHFGFNTGFNVAEATNLAVPEWIPFGRKARVCLCRPDSVRIDMDQYTRILSQYEADQRHRRRGARLTWKQWSKKRQKEEQAREKEEAKRQEKQSKDQNEKLSDQQRRHEFWVEVMKPIATGSPGVGRKKKKKNASPTKGSQIDKSKAKKRRVLEQEEEETWHLAKPIIRKRLTVGSKVLVIIPATAATRKKTSAGRGNDDDDEQCFAGQVTEFSGGEHVRVHLDGLPRTEDVWMPIGSSKLYADGGLWTHDRGKESAPALHYWEEMDSAERCA